MSAAPAYFSTWLPLGGSVKAPIVVPPGGFAGFAQQTPATQALFQRSGRVGGKRSAAKRRRKRAKTAKTATRKTARRRSARPARLVKGSPAAKRYMAKIRRKRRK